MLKKQTKLILTIAVTMFCTTLIPLTNVTATEMVPSGNYEKEDNKYFDKATFIELGTNCSGTLEADLDLDYYKVTIPKSVSFDYSLEVNQDSKLHYGYNLTVYDSKRNKLYKNENIDENFYQNDLILPPGDYYLKIENASIYGTTDILAIYTLTTKFKNLENYEIENDDNFDNTTFIKLDTAYSGTLYRTSDLDYYKITIPKSVSFDYSLEVNQDSGLGYGYNITLYDSKQNILYKNERNDENFYKNNLILPPGNYYLKVENASIYGPTNISAIYTLTSKTTKLKNSEIENNDTIKKSTNIKANTQYVGELFTSTDEDWYKVNIKGNSYIYLDMVVDNSYDLKQGYYAQIYNSNGSLINNSSGGSGYYWSSNESSEKIAVTKGTYCVVIKAYSEYSSPSSEAFYKFKIINKSLVKFNSNGGKTVASKSYVVDKTLTTLQSPKRTGYTFSGWYSKKTGGTKISKDTKVTKNVTYYAHWTKR